MKSSNFYEKKSQQSARIISLFCFSFTVLFAFSLLLFCLFSVVHHTQKFNLKLSPLIDLVINICPGKTWLFYLKLEVNMVFLGAGSSIFPMVSLFHEFWFLLFQWWSSLGQWWRKKDEQDKYSIDEDDHDHEDSNEEHVDCAPMEKKQKNKPWYGWLKTKSLARDITFLGNELSLPPAEELSAMQNFKKFWSNNITENMANQTNIYLVQNSGKWIDTNAQEYERFIGIQMLISMRSLPSYELYWSKDLCVDCVVNVTSLKQYELIRRYLHNNDNRAKKTDSSRLFKFETVANALHTNCLSIEQEQYLSINEQMVPVKTKRSGVLEYLPRKIHKWGFKKLCSGRCLWNHLWFILRYRTKKC